MKTFFAFVLSAASLAAGAPADAAYLHYVLSGDYNAEWNIDIPAAADETTSGSGIGFYDVDGVFPGGSPNYYADVRFYNMTFGGGLALTDHYDIDGAGPDVEDTLLVDMSGFQLYTGDEESNPVLSVGSWNFTGPDLGYRLTVQLAGVVAEPEAWGMMILGFGLMGVAMRARRTRVAFC